MTDKQQQETLELPIAPDVTIPFVRKDESTYTALRPIVPKECGKLREYVVSNDDKQLCNNNAFSGFKKPNETLYVHIVMTLHAAQAIINAINRLLSKSSEKGFVRCPWEGEVVDCIHTHWLQSDLDRLQRNVESAVDDPNKKLSLEQRAKEICPEEVIDKQLLWLVYERSLPSANGVPSPTA